MRTKHILSLIVMASYLAGCTSWRVQPVTPEQLVETERPGKVRVLTTQNQQLVFHQPFVRDDSLMGYVEGEATRMPLDQIVRVEKRQTDGAQTALVGLWIAALVVGGVIVAHNSDYMGGSASW